MIDSKAFDSTPALAPITVTPNPPYYPADRITLQWSLTNYSESALNGSRLAFDLGPGIRPDGGTLTIDGQLFPTDLDELRNGISLAALEPGTDRTFTLEATIENVVEGGGLAMSAHLTLVDGTVYASVPTLLPVQTEPLVILEEPVAVRCITAHSFDLEFTIANVGSRDAQGAILHVPIMSDVSAEIKVAPEEARIQSSPDAIEVTIDSVPAGRNRHITLHFSVPPNYPRSFAQIAGVTLTSDSCGTLHCEPIDVILDAHIDFSESRVLIETLPADVAEPGQAINVLVDVVNRGRTDARNVCVAIALPSELAYAPGSLTIGEASSANDDIMNVIVPMVRAHGHILVALRAFVRGPLVDEQMCMISATVAGEFASPATMQLRAQARFLPTSTYLVLDTVQTISLERRRTIPVNVHNVGMADAQHVRLRVHCGELRIPLSKYVTSTAESESLPLRPVSVIDGNGQNAWIITLDRIAAQESCRVEMEMQAPSIFEDETAFPVEVTLEHDTASLDLGQVTLMGRSVARISAIASSLTCHDEEPIRTGQTRSLSLRIHNEGSESARDVRVNFVVPDGLILQRIVGGVRYDVDMESRACVTIDEIAPQATMEAVLIVRAVRTPAGDGVFTIHPVVDGSELNRVRLAPLRLRSQASPFIDQATARIRPLESDGLVRVDLRFMNVGDGPAQRLRVSAPECDAYVAESTAIDGVGVGDIRGRSALFYGLVLPTPLAPGAVTQISYNLRPRSTDPVALRFDIDDRQRIVSVQTEPYTPRIPMRFTPNVIALPGAPPRSSERNDEETTPNASGTVSIPDTTLDVEAPETRSTHETNDEPIPQTPEPHLATNESAGGEQLGLSVQNEHEFEDLPLLQPMPIETGENDVDLHDEILNNSEPFLDPDVVAAISEHAAPVFTLAVTEEWVDRLVTTGLHLFSDDSTLGAYRHIFGSRLFLPTNALTGTTSIAALCEIICRDGTACFGKALMRTRLARFQPTPSWYSDLSTGELVEAAISLLRTLHASANSEIETREFSAFDINFYGSITREDIKLFDEFIPALDRLDPASLVNAVLALLMPTDSARSIISASKISAYRSLLLRFFTSLLRDEPYRRTQRMRADNEDLDNALRDIVADLPKEVLGLVA